MRSASWSASSRYWVVSRMVTPSARRSRMSCHMVWRLRGSRPVVGSSRKISRGRPIRVIAMSRRRFSPPEYVAGVRLATSTRSKSPSSWAVRARSSVAGRCSRRPMRSRFSLPVSKLSTAENCPVTPMRARTAPASPRRSCPMTVAVPASARITVDRIRTMVVLPAPFGPSSAKTSPSPMLRSTRSRTIFFP